MKLLECNHLMKQYGEGESLVMAVNDVSFSVEKGEFVSVVGASGSGKSTLLHLLAGVDKCDGGEVIINGTSIHELNENDLAVFRRKHIGLVYQFYNLLPVLNVDENIILPGLLDGQKKNQEKLDSIVRYLGLEERRNHLPGQLSGGQQQKVSIGRALYMSPELLLCDEPTGNLDSKASEDVVELLKKSNREYGQTIIMVTHDNNIARQADRMIRIADGKIVSDVRITK